MAMTKKQVKEYKESIEAMVENILANELRKVLDSTDKNKYQRITIIQEEVNKRDGYIFEMQHHILEYFDREFIKHLRGK